MFTNELWEHVDRFVAMIRQKDDIELCKLILKLSEKIMMLLFFDIYIISKNKKKFF